MAYCAARGQYPSLSEAWLCHLWERSADGLHKQGRSASGAGAKELVGDTSARLAGGDRRFPRLLARVAAPGDSCLCKRAADAREGL